MDNWRKSAYSTAQGGSCVEVGEGDGMIGIRDTKRWTDTVLRLSRDDFRRLVSTVRQNAL